jgi:hypothetical protein
VLILRHQCWSDLVNTWRFSPLSYSGTFKACKFSVTTKQEKKSLPGSVAALSRKHKDILKSLDFDGIIRSWVCE